MFLIISYHVCTCASSTVSSREEAKARLASSDVEVTDGREADTVDEPPTAGDKASERAGDVSSTSDSTMRRKREFMTSVVVTQDPYELHTSVASTMTPFRCAPVGVQLDLYT